MRLRLLSIAVLVLCVRTASGQAAFANPVAGPPNTQSMVRRTVAGNVVNSVTGEPLRRALVRLNGPEARSAFTGGDGRFEIPDVLEGQIFLTAQKPGFFEEGSSSQAARSGRRLVGFAFGPATGDIVLKLEPEARIQGRVVDRNGDPIENLSVQLLARAIVEGRNQWQQRGSATTDETGTYVLENLMPGTYAVHSLPLAVPGVTGTGAVSSATPSEVFPGLYYPDAPDLSSVQPLELKAGQEMPADFRLAAVPAFRVSGVVSGGQEQVMLMCEDREGQPLSYGMGVNPSNGKFTLSGIPPGSWVIRAISQQRQGPDGAAEANQPVEVTASDIKGLVLRLQPAPTIAVHVQNESAGQRPMVGLTAVAGTQGGTFFAQSAPGEPENMLSFRGLQAGRYRVSVSVPGNSACADSVMSGGTDLSREELTVSPGSQPAPIEVTLRNDCASITGLVNSASEQAANSFVVLVGDSAVHSPGAIQVGSDGKFSMANLTPGAYRLYAFNDITDLEYANPEALRDYSAREVSVAPNEKSNVQLDLITRKQ